MIVPVFANCRELWVYWEKGLKQQGEIRFIQQSEKSLWAQFLSPLANISDLEPS